MVGLLGFRVLLASQGFRVSHFGSKVWGKVIRGLVLNLTPKPYKLFTPDLGSDLKAGQCAKWRCPVSRPGKKKKLKQ